jgi:hypothetical protein
MKEWKWNADPIFVGLVIGGLLGALVLVFPDLKSWGAIDRAIQSIAAIGTAAAAIIALWLGGQQERRQHRASIDQARFICSGIGHRLRMGCGALESYTQQTVPRDGLIANRHEMQLRPEQDVEITVLQKFACIESLIIPPDVLAALLPLPNQTANRLHIGTCILKELHYQVSTLYPPSWSSLPTQARELCISRWQGEMCTAKDHFLAALREIEKIAPGDSLKSPPLPTMRGTDAKQGLDPTESPSYAD